MTRTLRWWQDAVIYQVIVPSFRDSNDDGYGDLGGLIEKLDYVAWLGARALWLSPIYPSPMHDLGYDVSDFSSVAPRFGSLETFDELVAEAHRRDVRVILDWVPNHTSSEHPWFIESCASRDSAKRDWYIWRDARSDGSVPNNWLSVFGGSVWEWHAPTQQFYLHTFDRTQPDLNWRNPEVQAAMLDTLRFWLERNVDGFRMDACGLIFKDEQFRDNPANPDFIEGHGPDSALLPAHTRDQPGLHEALARIRQLTDSYGADRLLLGELYLPVEKVVKFYGRECPELHLPLYSGLMWPNWNADALAKAIDTYQSAARDKGWPTAALSDHDTPRLAARLGDAQARVAAVLLLTQPGTLIQYYGEELGMRGVPIPPACARDPQGRRTGRNRDPERTPMQWENTLHAGFSRVEPWLPVAGDFRRHNVAVQRDDPGSLLTLYRRLIAFRRREPALTCGSYERLTCSAPLLAYRRSTADRGLVIVLNTSSEAQNCTLATIEGMRLVLSTHLDRQGEPHGRRLSLRADEGVILV